MIPILIGVGIAFVVFVLAWRQGAFLKLSAYVDETKQELIKCSWPTWAELWDSTKLTLVAIFLLGIFTVAADRIFFYVVKAITTI